jgi:hypothetical protein
MRGTPRTRCAHAPIPAMLPGEEEACSRQSPYPPRHPGARRVGRRVTRSFVDFDVLVAPLSSSSCTSPCCAPPGAASKSKFVRVTIPPEFRFQSRSELAPRPSLSLSL